MRSVIAWINWYLCICIYIGVCASAWICVCVYWIAMTNAMREFITASAAAAVGVIACCI